MCLSASALALFLNTIAAPVTTSPGQIIVHAEDRNAIWIAHGENWCTKAPERDMQARFELLDGAEL